MLARRGKPAKRRYEVLLEQQADSFCRAKKSSPYIGRHLGDKHDSVLKNIPGTAGVRPSKKSIHGRSSEYSLRLRHGGCPQGGKKSVAIAHVIP